jgi:hypothetical protein
MRWCTTFSKRSTCRTSDSKTRSTTSTPWTPLFRCSRSIDQECHLQEISWHDLAILQGPNSWTFGVFLCQFPSKDDAQIFRDGIAPVFRIQEDVPYADLGQVDREPSSGGQANQDLLQCRILPGVDVHLAGRRRQGAGAISVQIEMFTTCRRDEDSKEERGSLVKLLACVWCREYGHEQKLCRWLERVAFSLVRLRCPFSTTISLKEKLC